MDKWTCSTCPHFTRTETPTLSEGYCTKNPPSLSSIGVPSYPRITDTWSACGSHPERMALSWKAAAVGIVPVIIESYQKMMPAFDTMVERLADKMDKVEDKEVPCPHTGKFEVEGKGWACPDCGNVLTGD